MPVEPARCMRLAGGQCGCGLRGFPHLGDGWMGLALRYESLAAQDPLGDHLLDTLRECTAFRSLPTPWHCLDHLRYASSLLPATCRTSAPNGEVILFPSCDAGYHEDKLTGHDSTFGIKGTVDCHFEVLAVQFMESNWRNQLCVPARIDNYDACTHDLRSRRMPVKFVLEVAPAGHGSRTSTEPCIGLPRSPRRVNESHLSTS
jgi:hypothetical protein